MNNQNLIISVSFVAGLWIYYRKLDYYKSIPTNNLFTSLIIFIWSVLTLKYPIFLVIGLLILSTFGLKKI